MDNIEKAVRTIPIKIVKNPKFYKLVEDYINKASEILFNKNPKEKLVEDFYDRAVY